MTHSTPAKRRQTYRHPIGLSEADRRPDLLAEREARVKAHMERVERELQPVQRAPRDDVQPKPIFVNYKLNKPVISDRGERFPSAKDAATKLRKSAKAVSVAIFTASRCAERTWRYVSGRKRKPVRCIETGEVFASPREAGAAVGRSMDGIKHAIYRGHRCGGFHWHYVGTPVPRPKPRKPNARCRAVVSDRGEWFPSCAAASRSFGKRGKQSVTAAICAGCRTHGRYWRYATPAETAAANNRRQGPQEAAA
jgi:hypothetical protein